MGVVPECPAHVLVARDDPVPGLGAEYRSCLTEIPMDLRSLVTEFGIEWVEIEARVQF